MPLVGEGCPTDGVSGIAAKPQQGKCRKATLSPLGAATDGAYRKRASACHIKKYSYIDGMESLIEHEALWRAGFFSGLLVVCAAGLFRTGVLTGNFSDQRAELNSN